MKIQNTRRHCGSIDFRSALDGLSYAAQQSVRLTGRLSSFVARHLPGIGPVKAAPPATTAPALRTIISHLESVEVRIYDSYPVVAAQSWREVWEYVPRHMTDFDVELMSYQANPYRSLQATELLKVVTRRGHVWPNEAPLIRRILDLMLWPTVPAASCTRANAIREARRRLAAMHPDRWRHADCTFAVGTVKPYWELAMAFKTLFEHPIAGPRIFNERPALHELLPQLPSETLELLNDGSGVSRVAGARGLRSSALRHVETINWSQWATAVTLLIIFSLAISGIAFGVGYLVALT